METAHTSNDNPAEIAALFAYLDAPAEKVAPVAKAAEVAKTAKQTGKTADASGPVLTTTARGGITVLARMSKLIGIMAVTYTNRTQAERRAAALGDGWHVSAQWPFLIIKSN